MEYIKPFSQLLKDVCGEFQSEKPTNHLVFPFYHSIWMECQIWSSKTNPNWASAFNASTIKITKYITEDLCNINSLISCVLDPQYFQAILNQMGIPHSQYQPALDALSGEYYHHVEQLINEKDSYSLNTTPRLPNKKRPNSIIARVYYANITNYQLTRFKKDYLQITKMTR
ncbi:hypothetical protein O181_061328 [Austropuccinia psidii MF-1]|uniref:Uncharacterized protein n=1 Tax=Austropuccinia psidii MF-1 TaxID=1389203 RepID=A0A9Q3EHV7_9BASI|nr:hypothetical protein [Austropuccinia psidii MF-1]